MRGGSYVVNLDGYKSMRTYWIALYGNDKSLSKFDRFGVLNIFQKKSRD